ncbi:unnamed protein product [Darwinula stevensoni]|uniref:Tight junction protein ZO-1 n=1 Tax=Darwinula stevensoni TaxID=69355 RepID=A0A7R9A2R6_9CRUS|nr:unnamed protein product [Darwinula stevensoni]CAG0880498.1 unnamed protein product [Darwinula stevensoni]
MPMGGERVVWEFHNVTLERIPGYGFGIAVSGGRDNPHFTNGDPSIAISDVLKAGPAEGKLQINDRVLSANGVSLENVDYSTAVQVLRESGPTLHLVVKRRVILNSSPDSQLLKVTLSKNKKKEDFGIILGCKIYVKEITSRSLAEKEGALQEGDTILKINSCSTENMSLKEARKLVEGSREKLHLTVKRQQGLTAGSPSPPHLSCGEQSKNSWSRSNFIDITEARPSYTSQNLYVQPPTRGESHRPPPPLPPPPTYPERGLDISPPPPPRPPLPVPENDYYNSRRELYTEDSKLHQIDSPLPDPRFVSFHKEGSVGIRLTGGNETGIFITAVQPGSPAHLQGLQPGDKILKANQIDLIVQYRKAEYEDIVARQRGDSFYIKTHFNHEQPQKGEMTFRRGDIFHVIDTLHNGVVGAWQVFRIGRNNQETQGGVIPNRERAEELATAQYNASKKEQEQGDRTGRGSFFRRKRIHRRAKSLSRDHWDDVVFSDCTSKFPAYERVSLRHPGFMRPIVLFGPMSDVARETLLKDAPDKFASPHQESTSEDGRKRTCGIIRLSAIQDIMDCGKHSVLDVTPSAVDRLNYAHFYPVVIFLRPDSKNNIKELRAKFSLNGYKLGQRSSRKQLEEAEKLERHWCHLFTGTVSLNQESWFGKIREMIERQQTQPIWMSERKLEENVGEDFLFPMASRLSYASSPESDLESSTLPSLHPSTNKGGFEKGLGQDGNSPRSLHRASSDPSIAPNPLDSSHPPPPYSSPDQGYEISPGGKRSSQGGDSKYGFSPSTMVQSNHPAPNSSDSPPYPNPYVHVHPKERVVGVPPPSIDRGNKPKRNHMSARERLFPSHPSGLPPSRLGPSPLLTHSPVLSRSPPAHKHPPSCEEAPGPLYGSYFKYDDTDDMRSGSGIPGGQVPSLHALPPSVQPIKTSTIERSKCDSPRKIRAPDYKPIPPPKGISTGYKPIPPPKPKNYRPLLTKVDDYWPQDEDIHRSKRGFSTHIQDEDTNGFDSGHGSSLDRNCDSLGRNRNGYRKPSTGYYLNVVPPKEPAPLDHRENRGSAFELYKKPLESRYSEYSAR